MLTPVSCDHVTSFNYDDKKARDVGLTCWCHLSNIMSDSIFHESIRWKINCSVLFCLLVCLLFRIGFFACFFVEWYFCFRQDEKYGISSITIKSAGVTRF